MFLKLFGSIRNNGVPVTLREYLDLLEGLSKGLCSSNKIEDFYNEKFHQDYPIEFSFFKNFHDKYPVILVLTISYVGLGIFPPEYPLTTLLTPIILS